VREEQINVYGFNQNTEWLPEREAELFSLVVNNWPNSNGFEFSLFFTETKADIHTDL
jgi:hypothetical protein